MTLALEFHDSTVHRVRSSASEAIFEVTVFVHCSDGRPGFDAGTGWYQQAEIVVSDAVTERVPSAFPLGVYDGMVEVDLERFENLVPLPFDRAGRVRVELESGDDSCVVSGTRVRVDLEGTPGESEDFPGVD